MTLEKFKKLVSDYAQRNDGEGFKSFLIRNAFFIMTHRSEVTEILRAFSRNDKNSSLEVKP